MNLRTTFDYAHLCAIISKPFAHMASTILALSSASATLSFCWRKMEACWSEDLMIRATKRSYGGVEEGWRRDRKLIG